MRRRLRDEIVIIEPQQIGNMWAWWDAFSYEVNESYQVTILYDKRTDPPYRDLTPGTSAPFRYPAESRITFPMGAYLVYDNNDVPATGDNPRAIVVYMTNVFIPGGDIYSHVLHYGLGQTNQAYGLTIRGFSGHTGPLFTGPGNHFWNTGWGAPFTCTTQSVFLAIVHTPGTDMIFMNGLSYKHSITHATDTAVGALYVGSRVIPYFEGMSAKLCEIVIYSNSLSYTQIEGLYNYMRKRWGT